MSITRKAFIAGAADGIASLFLPSLPGEPDTFPCRLAPPTPGARRSLPTPACLSWAAHSSALPWQNTGEEGLVERIARAFGA